MEITGGRWRRRAKRDEPFGWWGPVWEPPAPRSLTDLIRQKVLSAEAAALLAVLIEARASVVVAAGPSGAGKTTLLTALLEALPVGTERIYLRGCYEPFDFLGQSDPQRAALLVNEISPHLPMYLWGPGVREVFRAAKQGYQLAATAHASSIEDFIYSLSGYPLRIVADDLRAVDLLILLKATQVGTEINRSVRAVVSLSADDVPGGIAPRAIMERESGGAPLVIRWDQAADLIDRLGAESADLPSRVRSRAMTFRL